MNVNRWVEGRRDQILIIVVSGVTVEIGDLMFLDNSDDLRNNGSSTKDNYAYPFSYLRISGASLALNKKQIKDRFLGVAMNDKDGVSGGANMNIPVATNGKFNFDLKPANTVKIGNYFGPSGTTTGSDILNQKVAKVSDSDLALGYFAEYKVHANSADAWIRTAFSSGGKI